MISYPRLIKDLETEIKQEYASLSGSFESRMMIGLETLVEIAQKKRDFRSLLHEFAHLIHRLFPFREVSIGIRDSNDGHYRYVEALGFAPTAKIEHLKLRYTLEEMFDKESYPYIRISKHTDFRFAEGEQSMDENEKMSFSRPSMLTTIRKNKNEMLEADYFDIYIYDQKRTLIGWIELAQPKDGKIPSAMTIKWLEIFCVVLRPYLERALSNP